MVLDGSLGHVTEVLSGDYYQPLSTNSPHQIWSAAMVVSPILRGLLGIDTDAQTHSLRFAPHVPAEWRSFSVDNLRVGTAVVSVSYRKTPGWVTFEVKRTGAGDCVLELSPALSLRSSVTSVDLNRHALPFQIGQTGSDQHVTMRFPVAEATSTIRIHLKNDFGLGFSSVLPPLGSSSQGLPFFRSRGIRRTRSCQSPSPAWLGRVTVCRFGIRRRSPLCAEANCTTESRIRVI